MLNEELVLIIDDDLPTTRLMRLILKSEGYELSIVHSREDGLTVVQEQRPSAIITDYLMAGLTLEDFIEKVRACDLDVPILLCTAMHQDIDAAVDGILRKPFSPDELPRTIARLISARRDRV